MAERALTKAGHDPEALLILVGALTPYVEEAERFRIAVDIFGLLHDAGLRVVPSAHIDGQADG